MSHSPQEGPPAGEKKLAQSAGLPATVALFTLLTVLAGMLGPVQSAVNGELGTEIGDGQLSAVISFGSGLVLMAFIVLPRRKTRNALFALPGQLRNKALPWPNFFAGLCGAVIVLSQGVSAGALGVATFQTSLISGMVISGVVCDRLGIGLHTKLALNLPRILGAILAVVATVLVVSPNFESPDLIVLAILPFVGGLLAGWQPAGNSNIGTLADSMLVSIMWNFIVGFSALGLVFLVRMALGSAEFTLPSTWWMYLGGPLGLLSIALMALLVRRLGLLLLALASTAGQLIGSIGIDALVPALGNTVYLVTVIGALVALVAAGIALIPTKQIEKDEGAEVSPPNVPAPTAGPHGVAEPPRRQT